MGILALVGLPFAMLHQVSSPIEYRCNSCNLDFNRRTIVAKIAGIFLIALVVGLSVLFTLIGWAIITGRIS